MGKHAQNTAGGSMTIAETAAGKYGESVAALKIAGAIDHASVTKLRGALDKCLADGHTYVIADMAGVDSVCSAALGELMRYRNKFVETGGDVVLVALANRVRSKLTVLGANRIFSFYQDERAAVNAYRWDFKKEGKTVAVTLPPYLKFIPPVRQFASRLARQNGYSVKDAFRIETIVDEVCNNAVDHGKKGEGGEITMQMAINKERVEITVTNQSDPEKIELLKEIVGADGGAKHVGGDEKRGRGLALIRMLSNEMNVNITERGTRVHVIKLREE